MKEESNHQVDQKPKKKECDFNFLWEVRCRKSCFTNNPQTGVKKEETKKEN